jgi:hypothetical protein
MPRLVLFQPCTGRYAKTGKKHGGWINKPARSKRRHALVASTASNVVSSARERAEASDWVRCAEVDQNAYGSSQTVIKLNVDNIPVMGLLSPRRSKLNDEATQ